MCGSTVRLLVGGLPLFLILLVVPSAPAGVCCLAPEKTCETVDDCDGGPCGPPCDDHLKCYRIRDSLRLEGVVNLDTKEFGLEPGCKIVGPQLFCVPATKTVKGAVDTSSSPPTPIELKSIDGPPASGDRLCYRMRCEKAPVRDLIVEDQFGTHEISRLRPSLLCTPAVKKTGCKGDDACPIEKICHESRCVDCVCPEVWAPVCGVDGVTYGNACEARCAHVEIAHEGPCEAECRCNADCAGRAVCREGRCQPPCEIQCLVHDPVCGSDGRTYGCGAVDAACHGVTVLHEGECRPTCTDDRQCDAGSFCLPWPACTDDCGCMRFCEPCACLALWDPVCGVDGVTYGNACEARCAHVEVAAPGECR
jgi:hypothetical protein